MIPSSVLLRTLASILRDRAKELTTPKRGHGGRPAPPITEVNREKAVILTGHANRLIGLVGITKGKTVGVDLVGHLCVIASGYHDAVGELEDLLTRAGHPKAKEVQDTAASRVFDLVALILS